MTLFSLNSDRKKIRSTFLTYVCVVIFCVIFGFVYETKAHGIISHFMLYGFIVPLVLGLIPYFILFITKSNKGPGTTSSYIYNAGVATLTVGCYFKGVLDIYGTTRDVYVLIYLIVGCSLLVLGFLAYFIALTSNSANDK